jgi:hypothetical protein
MKVVTTFIAVWHEPFFYEFFEHIAKFWILDYYS